MAPQAVAADYFEAWASHDLDAIMRGIAPNCVFVNGTMNVTHGADKIRAMFAAYLAAYPRFRFDVLHIALAADGKTVLNERLDFMFTAAGEISIPCAGAVVVEDGLITEIRDYFDAAAVQAQKSA